MQNVKLETQKMKLRVVQSKSDCSTIECTDLNDEEKN